MDRDSVVVVGSGMMGPGISAMSALAGNRTILVGRSLEKAERGVKNGVSNLQELVDCGLADPAAARKAEGLLFPDMDLEAALGQAKLVIETINENLSDKQDLFEKMDALLPADIPILSNTSGLRITDIAARVKHPERTVTTHFWFPAHLVPLVEVVIGDKTDEAVAVSVRDMLLGWGKAPIIVKKDLPGQLANRILQAIVREAVNIVAMGLASPEDVDTAVKMGMGIRFPAWGPLEHIDAVGLDLAAAVQTTVLPSINGSDQPNPYLLDLVKSGNLGFKTGKGFYDWSVKNMTELVKNRNAFIVHALKKIKK